MTLTESLETNGLAWKGDISFKDGHHCLAYNLIRTPNISRARTESGAGRSHRPGKLFAEPDGLAQTEKVRAEVQNITGLDLGREIFANIEQITAFRHARAGDSASPSANSSFRIIWG